MCWSFYVDSFDCDNDTTAIADATESLMQTIKKKLKVPVRGIALDVIDRVAFCADFDGWDD